MRKITRKKERGDCKICHGRFFFISQNGLCKNCMAEKVLNARSQIRIKEGPVYEKWKRRLAESLE